MSLERLAITDSRWAVFTTSATGALPYHHPAWAALLAECYGYAAFALVSEREGEITAGIPVMAVKLPLQRTRWVSLPFTDVCPVVAADADSEVRFLGAMEESMRDAGVGRWEVRTTLAEGGRTDQGTWRTLDLTPDQDEIFRGFKKTSVQQPIRKAERAGLTVREARTEEDLVDVFYGLHLRTRSRLGAPVQPKRFFRLLWRRILEPGLGFCLIVDSGPEPVASAVFLTANGKATYKYSASDSAHLRLRPNNLLLWHAIQRSRREGLRSFDFGRTEPGNDGLRQFKRGWGGTEHEIAYTTVGEARAGSSREAPGALATLIRKSPPWMCRAVGEALYKYAA